MSEHVNLTAQDGHILDAYVARPKGKPMAGLVVVQEAFGVNSHIRLVADGFAAEGYLAVAPALYDRVEPGVELGYSGEDMQKGIAIARQLDLDKSVMDVDAAVAFARRETGKKVGVVGYCLGGSMAWLAATRLKVEGAVGYYGGYITKFAQENPKAPVMLHFGREDQHIPKEQVDATMNSTHPGVPVFWYDAGHGFNCNDRASYNEEAAKLAKQRTLNFFHEHLLS